MSRSSTQELDVRIQFSLVTKIRHAATVYNTAPANASPEALENYLSALESLAEYVAAKWRGELAVAEAPAARHALRIKRKSPPRQESSARIIPFSPPADGAPSPLTAA
jgi:hypothetical protein